MSSVLDEIILTKQEVKTLRYIAKHKRIKTTEIDETILYSLLGYHLISRNYSGHHINEIGENIDDGTVSVTDNYLRFKKLSKNNFIERKIPIILSTIALIVSIISLFT